MKKIKVAVFFGGCSSEYHVSLESAYSVLQNLNPRKYDVFPIGISQSGKWFYFTGNTELIKNDRWQNERDCIPAILSPNREKHQLILFSGSKPETIALDAAFPVMHGKYGEDGTLQGYIEMTGIPLVGCGVLSSALCMDKNRAHKLASLAGVSVPKSLCIQVSYDRQQAAAFAECAGYPIFVKPVKAGSSYGVTRAEDISSLFSAIDTAFSYDNEVIIEEAIDGFEVGCAVMGYEKLTVGEVDEIELSGGFFDYTEKYTLMSSTIYVPARIPKETAERIKETAKTLYRALGCCGFARVDLFLTPEGKLFFNEINTIPGFTEHSRFPGMMKAAGLPFSKLLDTLILAAIDNNRLTF